MTEFYSDLFAQKQRAAYLKWRRACFVAAAAALVVCTVLCFFVNTRNATALFCAVSGISIAVGWLYMLYFRPKRRVCRAQYIHCENILEKADVEYLTGRISVSPYVIQIPGSIRVRAVKVEGAEKASCHLNACFSLPADGTKATLHCAGGYVTGYEVLQDA